jgi:hypothetical protein
LPLLRYGPAQHTNYNRGELYIGELQQLVQPVHLSHPLIGQGLAVAGQIPQVSYGFRRYKAPVQQPVGQKIGYLLAVLDIGLTAERRFDVSRIDQKNRKGVLQQVVTGFQ